jgi:predicted Zn-dependent protease
MSARFVSALAVVAMGLSIGACKLELTPDSIAKTYTAIKDARKDLTPENEYYVGRSVATHLLARHDYKYLDAEALSEGRLEGLTEYVNMVGNVIALAAIEEPRKGDRPTPIAGWHFVVVEDDVINAFAAPGGYIFVTSAAVEAAQTEDELAAILAHEVAHVSRGHALGSIKKSRWAGVAKEFLDSSVELDEKALGKLTEAFEGALDDMVDSLLVKGYSKNTEYEADKVGVEIMARAGYDPRAMIAYLETLDASQDTGSGGFSSTHPKATDRISKLDSQVAKIGGGTTSPARTERFQYATADLRNDMQ